MRIVLARPVDVPAVQAAYAHGHRRQRAQGTTVWPEFPDAAVLAEISAGWLLRVLSDAVGDDRAAGGALAGVFSVAYEDPAIWGERECGAHVYLHRIARAAGPPAAAAGRGLMAGVVAWADAHARGMGRARLQMDTWAGNAALVGYYERAGFGRVGRWRIGADARLPAHYHGIEVALLERPCAVAG